MKYPSGVAEGETGGCRASLEVGVACGQGPYLARLVLYSSLGAAGGPMLGFQGIPWTVVELATWF